MELLPSDELLYSIKNKYFIVSLPRTGTKSLCKMFMLLGYQVDHCPSIRLSAHLQSNEFGCFADTPIYRPSLVKKLALEPSNKFIYIDRPCDQWLLSFERMKLHQAYMDYISRDADKIKPISQLDRDSLVEVFGGNSYSSQLAIESFHKHKHEMFDVILPSQLLTYQFKDGWVPLCNFLGEEILSVEIPHLNKNQLFDKIT